MADQEIKILYYNEFGISFFWNNFNTKDKIQLVFRNTGLQLSKDELIEFSNLIFQTEQINSPCQNCSNSKGCQSILLQTPLPQLNIVVSTNELIAAKDLIAGTMFHWNLNNLLNSTL